jgi:hypothetical protein
MWIDAISINQNDIAEKEMQIMLMKNIYSGAQGVIAWLGEEAGTTALAVKWLRRLSVFYKSEWQEGASENPVEKALADFFTSRWWKRAWIVQEMVCARHVAFACGRHFVPLQEFEDELWMSVQVIGKEVDDYGFPAYLSSVTSLLQTRGQIRGYLAGGCSFPQAFRKHLNRNATLSHDHIYSLLGLSEVTHRPDVMVSYKSSVKQAYAHFVKRWIARYSDLDVITNHIECLDRVLHGGDKLPSWVPDWSGKQRLPRWDVGTSNTWGRSGGFSTWTVGPFGPEGHSSTWRTAGHPRWNIDMAITEHDQRKVLATSHYCNFLTLDGVAIGVLGEVKCGSCNKYKTFLDLFYTWEPEDLHSGAYITGESKVSAFLQTLLSGRYTDHHLITAEEVSKLINAYHIHVSQKGDPPDGDESSSKTFFHAMLRLLAKKLHGRTFAITTNGYYSMVPLHAQPGDKIVALVGGNVPFVLRKIYHKTESAVLDGGPRAAINGPAYPGTSRGPNYPLIHNYRLARGQENNKGIEDVAIAEINEFVLPSKVPGLASTLPASSIAYHNTFEVVGTAYVHGAMTGEIKRAYGRGEATLQTYMLV